MTFSDIIREASQELGLPEEYVSNAYKSFWEFIKDTIQNLPLNDDLDEQQFSQLRTNFNVPSLGKLNCIYDKYKVIKEKYKHIKSLKNVFKDNKN